MKLNLLENEAKFSFNQLEVQEPEERTEKKRQFIRKETIIDKFTTKRERREITPSVCTVCALDIAEFNGLGSWNNVPEEKKSDIIRAVAEHKKIVHPVKEDLIILEDELPTSWLGHKSTL